MVVDANGVRVDAPSDLARFHVEAPVGLDVDGALRRGGFGHLDVGGHDAHVSIAAVRRAVDGLVDLAAWGPQFEGMLRYARSRGWLDDAGELIRGHVDRT